ncbi:PucR family transcriptional regulator [Streptomyces sp. NPDC090052]|uniref:PucR family transcriptional regulator n=1 Tax=unclassified Streptomyces TaxID=2593676 RepID=UPI002253BDCD|nr:helix-turn-helix domain-containing protein [Streptomyces sp. NBC_01306]MCX4722381.1 helix-turn-helix domain-containing protein [Streptomyces sp. NBC_01306]
MTYVEEPEGSVPGLSAGARKLAARCEPQVNELARRMARGAFENLGGYAELPADVKDVEIAATARHAMRLFLRSAVRGPRPSDDGLETFQTRAAQRAEEGMPLQLLLRTYCMGTRELWRELRKLSEPGEEGALVELGDALFAVQDRVVGAVTESYLDEQSALAAEQRERRRSLAQALLDGTAHPERSLADGPALVVFMQLSGGSGGPGGRSPVTVRRLVRRIQAALDRAFGTEALTLLDGAGGHAIAPGCTAVPDQLPELLREIAGPDTRLGACAVTEAGDIPRAAHMVGEVVRIAQACGRPPGLHLLDDVLLEYHLSRPNEGSDRIAALLAPLAGRPELVETLRTHLAQRQDRRVTARLLNLHPNSVDNRLTRIMELTGLDLGAPRDAALALAALALGATA